jgi:hypothetical protein
MEVVGSTLASLQTVVCTNRQIDTYVFVVSITTFCSVIAFTRKSSIGYNIHLTKKTVGNLKLTD